MDISKSSSDSQGYVEGVSRFRVDMRGWLVTYSLVLMVLLDTRLLSGILLRMTAYYAVDVPDRIREPPRIHRCHASHSTTVELVKGCMNERVNGPLRMYNG